MVGMEKMLPTAACKIWTSWCKAYGEGFESNKALLWKTGKVAVENDCEPCIAGKFERKPAPRGPHEPYADEPCEICAIDVSGPHLKAITGNFIRSLVCVDLVLKVTGVCKCTEKPFKRVGRNLKKLDNVDKIRKDAAGSDLKACTRATHNFRRCVVELGRK